MIQMDTDEDEYSYNNIFVIDNGWLGLADNQATVTWLKSSQTISTIYKSLLRVFFESLIL